MKQENNRFFGMLGFAMRAGKLVIGTDAVCLSMAKTGAARPRLVLLCADASGGTKKKICVKAAFYGIDVLETEAESEKIGALLGKTYAPMAIAVLDEGFAKELRKAGSGVIRTAPSAECNEEREFPDDGNR